MSKKNQIKLSDLAQKQVLTTAEVCAYTGWSRSALYKLMMAKRIPYSKPNGKYAYFDRLELESYLMSARIKTTAEVEAEAQRIGRAL